MLISIASDCLRNATADWDGVGLGYTSLIVILPASGDLLKEPAVAVQLGLEVAAWHVQQDKQHDKDHSVRSMTGKTPWQRNMHSLMASTAPAA